LTSIEQVPLSLAKWPFIDSGDLNYPEHVDTIRSRQLKVLLIDDTDEFRESMTDLLTEKYGAAVTDVDSGSEAVALLKAGKEFNVIFLDLIMPGMNAVETYKALQQAGLSCRVIVMSAHPDSPVWQEAEELGMELIEKPIEQAALITILSEL